MSEWSNERVSDSHVFTILYAYIVLCPAQTENFNFDTHRKRIARNDFFDVQHINIYEKKSKAKKIQNAFLCFMIKRGSFSFFKFCLCRCKFVRYIFFSICYIANKFSLLNGYLFLICLCLNHFFSYDLNSKNDQKMWYMFQVFGDKKF